MSTVYLLQTDTQQSVLSGSGFPARAYSAFGVLPSAVGPMQAFAGEVRDQMTGCYLLGNGRRAYNPVLMRFQSPDSVSPFGRGGINAYAYCGGDPVNRVDPSGATWLSRLISGISMSSSAVTIGGAVTRTARNVVNRLSSRQTGTVYVEPSLQSRIGNTSLFYTGAMGVAGTALSGVEQGWVGNALTSNGSRFGMGNAIGNINGGLFSNAEAAQAVWRGVGQPGVSAGRVAWESFYEVTGARMVGEGASYLWRQGQALGSRLRATYRAGVDAWRSWAVRPTAPPAYDVEMRNLRRS